MAPIARPVEDRLWEKVDRSGGPDVCWPWTAAVDKDGYGVFTDGSGKYIHAHRMVWIILFGSLKSEEKILHRCDNPPCCNPACLFKGTALDNMQDKMKKGRGYFPGPSVSAKGEAHGNALLTEEQVREIRSQYVPRKVPLRVFAERYGVQISTIHYALKEGWRHVGGY
jgi:hypothetical protein